MKSNLIKLFILISVWVTAGIFFAVTVSAQVTVNQDVNTTSTSRRVAPIPGDSDIFKLKSCYRQTLSANPDFPSGIQGLAQKIPNGVNLWYEWGPGNTTYQTKEVKKNWTSKEIADDNGTVFDPPINKEWTINLEPDTIYSYVLAYEIPAGGERRQPFIKFSYPKFLKTNKGFICIGEGEELYFKELDSLSLGGFFDKKRGVVSAYILKDDPDAIPLALVPSGTIISTNTETNTGTCRSGAVMSKSGAWMCGSVIDEFNAMVGAAKKAGIDIKSGAYSGMRTLEMQRDMRKNRRCRNETETSCPGGRIAAVGKSNHTNGDAADFACYNNGKLVKPFENSTCYTWLKTNAATFHFYNDLPDDRVHWSRTGR